MTIDCFLCQSHENIARSNDLIDTRNGFGSKSQRCDCLGTADFINFGSACQMCSNQGNRVYFSVFSWWRYHNNLLDSCNLSRDNVHQYGRRIGCLAARNINTDTGKCAYLLTKNGSVWFAVEPAVTFLFFMVLADVFHGFFHDSQKIRVYLGQCLLNFCLGYTDIVCRELCAVKFFCILEQGFIASGAYIIHDLLDCALVSTVIVRVTL